MRADINSYICSLNINNLNIKIMSEQEMNYGVPAETQNEMVKQVKKNRRGVTNETRAVAQLKFHEKDSTQNGLFIGHLVEVTVGYSIGKEGTNFAGMKTPYLTFHFASQHTKSEEQRHVYNTLFPVESNVSTIPGGNEEWKVNNVLHWIKHILDIYYLKGGQLTDFEEEALSLPFSDFDENGDYVMIEPEEVLAGYGYMFNNVVALMDGKLNLKDGETPKCVYKDANGKPIAVWMKLLRHRKSKKGWTNVTPNGELGFDSFIGNGVIEIFKGNGTAPSILRLDLSKESIIPQKTNKEPTIGGQIMPGLMNGGVLAATPNDAGNMNAFFDAGVEDMPF